MQRHQDLYYTPFSFSPFEGSSSIINHHIYSITSVIYVSYGSYAFITKYISLLSIYDPPEVPSPEATPSPEDLQPEAFASPAVPAPDLQLQSSPRRRSARADTINPTPDCPFFRLSHALDEPSRSGNVNVPLTDQRASQASHYPWASAPFLSSGSQHP